MKILVLAESLRINTTSSGIVSSTFIKALENSGHEITCLYEDSHDITSINFFDTTKLEPISYSKRKKIWIDKIPKLRGLETFVKGINVDFKSKIIDWKNKINLYIKEDDFDLIIALGSGASFLPHYTMLEVNTKIPWMANFHDPYPFSLYPKPYKVRKNLIYWKQEKFTKKIIKKATFVSFPSQYLKDWMQSFFPLLKEKSYILPHVGIQLKNLPTSEIDNKVNLEPNKFNIVHAGTLLGPRNVKALFNAFHRFLNFDEEIKNGAILNVFGRVAKEHKITINENKGSSNLNIITDRLSYKRSLELTKEADVSLIIEADSNISPFMPGKLADLIFLEKPILALTPKKSETLRILGEYYPFSARVNDEEQIFIKLLELWNLWKGQKLVLLERDRLMNYVSPKRINDELENLFKKS
jgi:hypothetical protein